MRRRRRLDDMRNEDSQGLLLRTLLVDLAKLGSVTTVLCAALYWLFPPLLPHFICSALTISSVRVVFWTVRRICRDVDETKRRRIERLVWGSLFSLTGAGIYLFVPYFWRLFIPLGILFLVFVGTVHILNRRGRDYWL